MIRSFADEETRQLWFTGKSRKLGNLAKVAVRKLQMLDFAVRLEDLRVPAGNRLERLHGDREGKFSIRVNEQYRVCFRWEADHAWEVEIVDYH